MSLLTQQFAPDEAELDGHLETGWMEVRRGLHNLLLGYLLCLFCLLLMGALVGFSLAELTSKNPTLSSGDVETVLFAGAAVLLLLGGYSLAVLVRAKWRCLMNASERYGAKWWMFSSILCLLATPALNFVSALAPAEKPEGMPKVARTAKRGTEEMAVGILLREVEAYKKAATLRDMTATGWMKLAGNVAGLLSTVFFVLFLRSVALCFEDTARARLAESYLVFVVLLFVGMLWLLFGLMPRGISGLQVVLGLAAGQLLSMLWYFFLVINTSVCIAAGVERERQRRTLLPPSRGYARFSG
jgi:hypothetical protein